MPAYSQSTILTARPSSMKFALRRSLWHGRIGCGPRARPLSPPRSRAPPAAGRGGGGEGRWVLEGAVDAEVLGVLAADADDVGLAGDRHPVVLVRDAATERLDRGLQAGPEAGEGLPPLPPAPLNKTS